MYDKIVIGIDQSYEFTGVSVSADKELRKVAGINLSKYKTKTDKRKALKNYLNKACDGIKTQGKDIICIIERIRLYSRDFINIDYIKSIGALNGYIVDVMHENDIKVYSVDTRAWKSQIIGTTKGKSNKFGVPEEKWPTVEYIINKGFEDIVLEKVQSRKIKGTFVKNGEKYKYNDDKCDSAAISLYGFFGNKNLLKEEN